MRLWQAQVWCATSVSQAWVNHSPKLGNMDRNAKIAIFICMLQSTPHRDVNWETFCPNASLVVLAPDDTLFTTHIMVHRNSYHYIERQYWPHQTWLSMLLQQNVFLNSAKSHFFQRALYNEMKYKSRFTIGIQLYWWRVGKSSRRRDLAEVSGTFWNTFYSKSNQRATPFLQHDVLHYQSKLP